MYSRGSCKIRRLLASRQKDDKWTVFISMDNLKSFGINPDKYYNMNNKIVNGKLIINCFHLEVPEE